MMNTNRVTAALLLAALSGLTTGCVISLSELIDTLTGNTGTAPPEENPAPKTDPCDAKPNGCGPSALWAAIIPDCPLGLVCFTEACNQHDMCYATCGSSQAGCDRRFYLDMMGLCAGRYAEDDPLFGRCAAVASVYYRAVDLYGEAPFDLSQVAICSCLASLEDQQPAARPIPVELIVPDYADDDQDLMPDDWEVDVGLNPANPLDAFEDPDADGLANLTEFIHGTNPFNPDSDGDGLDDAAEAQLAQQP